MPVQAEETKCLDTGQAIGPLSAVQGRIKNFVPVTSEKMMETELASLYVEVYNKNMPITISPTKIWSVTNQSYTFLHLVDKNNCVYKMMAYPNETWNTVLIEMFALQHEIQFEGNGD